MEKNMDKIEELISEQAIIKKVEEIGNQINKDFQNDKVMIVSVLKGSFIFTADSKLKDTDPETGGSDSFPTYKQFVFGVNITF